MMHWVYETPWWLPTLFCGVGAYLFWTGNNRSETRLRNAGIGVFVFGLLLAGLSYVLESPREKAQRHTKEIVQAIVNRDWVTTSNLLDPKVSFAFLKNREQVLAGLKKGQELANVKSARILSWDTAESPDNISITLDLVSTQDYTGGSPFPSAWRFDWVPSGDGDWKLIEVKAIRGGLNGTISGEQIEARMPGR